jgi:hypothetical protein
MIITEKQLICLMDILKDTLRGITLSGQYGINHEQRRELYEIIINQQSQKLEVIE